MRNLLQRFFGQEHWIVLVVAKWHELDDIRIHKLPIFLAIKWHLVCIKLVHSREVSTAHPHYNNREGHSTRPHNLVDRLLQVVDDPIGDNEQNVVFLVELSHFHRLCHVNNKLEQTPKMGWPVKINLL